MHKFSYFRKVLLHKFRRKFLAYTKLFPYNIIELESYVSKLNLEFERKKVYAYPRTYSAYHPVERFSKSKYFNFRYVYHVKNVIVNTTSGYVFSDHKHLVLESSSWPSTLHKFALAPGVNFAPLRSKIPSMYSGIILPSNKNFYHWLIEDMPLFLEARQRNKDLPVIVNTKIPNYVLDFVVYENIPQTHHDGYVNLVEYEFTGRDQDPNWPDPIDLSYVRKYFVKLESLRDPELKIYISRLSSSRSPIFENELVEQLSVNNWVIVHLENLNLYEQFKLFASAKVVAGLHGAGLSGIVWLSPGCKVVEICDLDWRYTPVFSRISAILDLNYEYLYYSNSNADSINGVFVKLLRL